MNQVEKNKSPFLTKFSVKKFIERYPFLVNNEMEKYKINVLNKIDALLDNSSFSKQLVSDNNELFKDFFAILIPPYISDLEMKFVSLPYEQENLFSTNKLNNTFGKLKKANLEKIVFNNINDDELYRLKCILILNTISDNTIEIDKKLSYKFEEKSGIFRNFTVANVNRFFEVKPNKKTKIPTSADINNLLEDFDNFDLWEKYFPENSWEVNGFNTTTFVENSIEYAVEELKVNLLELTSFENKFFEISFKNIFRTIFNVEDLKVGVTFFNQEDESLYRFKSGNIQLDSFLLKDNESKPISILKEDIIFKSLISDYSKITIQDTEMYLLANPSSVVLKSFIEKEIESLMIAPLINNDKILGFIELVSNQKYSLKKHNISRLNLVLPILSNIIEKFIEVNKNKIDAIIQTEYTSIHPSVYWKFKQQANNFLKSNKNIDEYNFKDVVFSDVYALFGQIDIKDSSANRIEATIKDVKKELNLLIEIFEMINDEKEIIIIEQNLFELKRLLAETSENYESNTDSEFKNFIVNDIHPILKNFKITDSIKEKIKEYNDQLDDKLGIIYDQRKNYDYAVMQLNKKISNQLDEAQVQAQDIFPHYYERHATDGVEHNIYIGSSINPKIKYNPIYLNNLRLWQLQTLCETVHDFQKWKKNLKFPLEVATLILAFSTPLTIRFRMDEKLFDVDGAYNAKYEVVKKRIDKANVKNSEDRITRANCITIVYIENSEKSEYTKYLKYLASKDLIEPEIEKLEVEDLQGLTGLKALRVIVKK